MHALNTPPVFQMRNTVLTFGIVDSFVTKSLAVCMYADLYTLKFFKEYKHENSATNKTNLPFESIEYLVENLIFAKVIFTMYLI